MQAMQLNFNFIIKDDNNGQIRTVNFTVNWIIKK